MKDVELRSLTAMIEDALIGNFDHRKRSSSICMSGETCDLEVSYDALTGKVEAMIYGDDVRKSYPNVQKLIEDSISTEKIDNEVYLEEMRDDEEYEAVMDNRMALDRAYGYGYGIYW